MMKRREMLTRAAGAVATVFAGPVPLRLAGGANPRQSSCVLTGALEEGPFFVDERLERSDVRSDPATGAVSAGIPLTLRFSVVRADDRACAPLTGAYLDIWNCDASGAYSDESGAPGPGGPRPGGRGPGGGPGDRGPGDSLRGRGPGGTPPAGMGPPGGMRPPGGIGPDGMGPGGMGQRDTAGHKFLRGYQLTDGRGMAEFTTVYPGWYPGRTVHVHFKIRIFAGGTRTYEFTSQLFLDDALTDQVHALPPYAAKGRRPLRNADDFIYTSISRAERDALTLSVQPHAGGYLGAVDVAVRIV
jgi:protocatechuate 3,4-dioxygenase beta subunit